MSILRWSVSADGVFVLESLARARPPGISGLRKRDRVGLALQGVFALFGVVSGVPATCWLTDLQPVASRAIGGNDAAMATPPTLSAASRHVFDSQFR